MQRTVIHIELGYMFRAIWLEIGALYYNESLAALISNIVTNAQEASPHSKGILRLYWYLEEDSSPTSPLPILLNLVRKSYAVTIRDNSESNRPDKLKDSFPVKIHHYGSEIRQLVETGRISDMIFVTDELESIRPIECVKELGIATKLVVLDREFDHVDASLRNAADHTIHLPISGFVGKSN